MTTIDVTNAMTDHQYISSQTCQENQKGRKMDNIQTINKMKNKETNKNLLHTANKMRIVY